LAVEVEETVVQLLRVVVVVEEEVPHRKVPRRLLQMLPEVLPVHQPQTYLLSEGQVVSVLSHQTVGVQNMVVLAVRVETLVMFLVMVVVHYGVVLVVVREQ
jgi:hypothetical protein